jgi:hypothetical protein
LDGISSLAAYRNIDIQFVWGVGGSARCCDRHDRAATEFGVNDPYREDDNDPEGNLRA